MSENGTGPVCVLGFSRSGTSLTMRLLNLMGVDLGAVEDLVPPIEAENPRGYWEPRWMLELNDEILAMLGTDWWHPLPEAPGWERRAEFDPLRERARALLEEKLGGRTSWGWKEPRTTLTLPFWRELVPQAKYVICIRNPVDAISSLQRRPEPTQSTGAWGDLWLDYTARALAETRDQPRLIVFYEDYLQDSSAQIERLASFIGLDPSEAKAAGERLSQEVDRNLRHHSTSSLELAVAWGIPPVARLLYLSLRAAEDLGCDDPEAGRERDLGISKAVERIAPELLSERQLFNTYSQAAAERLELVNSLDQVAADRLELINELDRLAKDRLREVEASATRIEALEVELGALREESSAT